MEEQDIKELSVEDNAVINYLKRKVDNLQTSLNQSSNEYNQYLNLCAIRLGIDNNDLRSWTYEQGKFIKIVNGEPSNDVE